jgi:hypothetical protein
MRSLGHSRSGGKRGMFQLCKVSRLQFLTSHGEFLDKVWRDIGLRTSHECGIINVQVSSRFNVSGGARSWFPIIIK